MANLLSTIVTGGSGTTPTLSLDRNIAAPSNYYNGVQLEIKATSGTAGIGLHRNGFSHVGIYHNAANELRFDMNSGTVILNHNTGTIWGSGNLTNLNQLTNGPGYITSVGNITRLWAESHPDDYYVRANWTGSYWQLTSNHPSPVQVGYADNAAALSGLGVDSFLRDDGWNTSPGQDANTQEQMRVDFTYSNNAPYTGELIRFGSSGYSTQFNTSYGNSDNFAFRTRNGDNGTWNPWKAVIHSGNIGSQSVSVARQLLSPNDATVVAADSAMPSAGHSFIHTLAFGPGGNDGHILGMTWAGTTSVYGAQIFIDTDPTDTMAIRSRSNAGVWTSWKTIIHSGTIGSQSVSYASSAGTLTNNAAISGLNFSGVLALAGSGASTGNSIGARLSESYGPYWNLGDSATWHYQIVNGSLLVGISAAGVNYGSGNIRASGDIFSQTNNAVIHAGNIGSQSVNYATTAGSAPNGSNANSFYDVTPGDGNGLRFWSSDQYKISMGVGSLYQYGTVYDYSIKTQMDVGSPGRGFTWGRINIAPIASLNATSGNFQVAGTIANGSIWINNGSNYNNYNENIRLFDAPNGASVIAFSASGTEGSPRTSLLGYSDRLETRVSDTWEQRIYGGYVEARGSFRAPIFYDSADTGYSWNPNTTNAHRFSTPSGYVDIGPMNGSWCHFQTDRPRFYFGNSVTVDGDLKRYSDSALYIHSANYNSYAPTLTGGGASGSWTISVSGSANSLDSSNFISRTGTSGDYNQDFRNTPAGSVRHHGDDATVTNNPGGAWWFIDNYRHSNSSNFWGTQVAWGWEDNANRLATRNVIAGNFGAWVYYLNSSNFTTYAQEKENQRLSTTNNVIHNSTTSPTILVNSHSDNLKGYRINNTSNTSVSAMFVNSSNQLVIAAGAVDQINLNKKVYVLGGSIGVNVIPSTTPGRIDASNDIVAFSSSDERLKENIIPIVNALDKVKSLTGVEFDWKPEYKEAHGHEGHDTGIIAQEVQDVMPSAVRMNETGFLAVRYEKLIGLLIEANKELAARVEKLENKL